MHILTALCLWLTPPAVSFPHLSPTPDSAPGRLVGRVIDGASGSGIPGARVGIDVLGLVAQTDMDGRYTLLNVPAGTHAVTARTIGYAPKTVTGVVVAAGAAVRLDVTLEAAAIQIQAVQVTAAVERGSVAQALAVQRGATQIVSAISAEQIERSPDSDAGQVMQRVSGATVQDGKYVFVRGLGERYTTASLNNARLPSPEPDRKVVPLDLFPSGLLQSVVTSKTYTADQPGDFTGAQVDLRTREFPAERIFTMSFSSGYNAAVTGKDIIAAPRVGSEWYGFAGAERRLPAPAAAVGRSLSGLSQTDVNEIINSFRNVWTPWTETAKPNGSSSVSLGGESIVAGRPLGYVASLSYSEGQEVRHDEQRAITSSDGVVTSPLDATHGSTGMVSVLWGGMLNLATHVSPTTKLSINNTYTRSLENQATRSLVDNEEFSQVFLEQRLSLVERTMRSSQLRGEHLLAGRHGLTWSLTSSGVTRYEPDRSDVRYQTAVDGNGQVVPTSWWGSVDAATRTFADLSEGSLEGAGALTLNFGAGERQLRIRTGGAYRSVHRDSDARAYQINNRLLTEAQRTASPEQIFNGAYAASSDFLLLLDQALGQYAADDAIAAGFVQVEAPLSDQIRVIAGARVERWALDLTYSTPSSPSALLTRRNTDLLPALAVNFKVSPDHTLRFSATQTVARPEYREMTPIPYRALSGEYDLHGDTALQRSLVRNLDARWEWYPSRSELVSAGVFAKWFDAPIEKVIAAFAGSDGVRFVNADGARSYGLELELRKSLLSFTPALAPFTVFANATIMRSEIRSGALSLTNTHRPMVGQANYVLNGGIGYAGKRVAATLLYNVVGPRVYQAGSNPRPDAYEQPRRILDFSAQVPLFGRGLTLKFDAKNLLDSPVHITQGQVTRLRYTTGRLFSLAATWQP